MKKKSTSASESGSMLSIAAMPAASSKGSAGSPRLSTLSRIRQFARAYHCEAAAGIEAAMILN